MKKFLNSFILCLLVCDVCGMREKRDLSEGSSADQSMVAAKRSMGALSSGVDECVAAMVHGDTLSQRQQDILREAISAADTKRAQLLPKEPRVLAYDFQRELFSGCRYARIKKFLERGVDPNVGGYLATCAHYGDVQVVALLLAYGADPNLRAFLGDLGETPIAYCRCVENARLLKHYGARIDRTSRFDVFNLCAQRYFELLVWFLNHGVDPDCGRDGSGVRAVHYCIGFYNLPGIIALMQHGVQLDVQGTRGTMSLDGAQSVYNASFVFDDHARIRDSRAVYELFKALVNLEGRKARGEVIEFDVREVYPLEKYESLGISRESAACIQEATLKVFKTSNQLDGDDVAYDGIQGINVTKFVHDRELGRGRKKWAVADK